MSNIAVASDPVHGPLIAALLFSPDESLGDLLVKEGSLTALWDNEHDEVFQAAVASDPILGPLIGIQTYASDVLAKEGSLTALWDTEHSDTSRVAVAG